MMNLEGKKTYISAAAAALASFALAMGWLSQEQYQVIIGLAGSLGLAALRSGVGKSLISKAAETDAGGVAQFGGNAPVTESRAGDNV